MGFFKTYKKVSKVIDKAIEKVSEKNNDKSNTSASIQFTVKESEPVFVNDDSEQTYNTSKWSEYAQTIFLDIFSRPKEQPETEEDFPRYVVYSLNIYNPVEKFNELLGDGYLKKADARSVLETYKVTELKSILKENKIAPGNKKKADLINVIVTDIDVNSLDLPEKFILSQKGEEYVEKNSDFVALFSNPYGISYLEYIKVRPEDKKPVFRDAVWGILNKKQMEIPKYHNGGRRCIEYSRGVFLKNERKQLQESLSSFIVALYYDINEEITLKRDLKNEDYYLKIAPLLEEEIVKLQEFYSPELISACIDRAYIYPEPTVPEEDFEQMVKSIFEHKEISLKKYIG